MTNTKKNQYGLYAFWSLVGLLLFVLYGLGGNAQEVSSQGRSAVMWMVNRWSLPGVSQAHCWVLPFVSVWILWLQRKEISAAPKQKSYIGLMVVIGSLLLHWFGYRSQLTRLSLVSLVGLFWGIPFYLYGRTVAKIILFPCMYLLFCIPLSFLDFVTFPLRMITSSSSAVLLNGLGIVAEQTGTVIYVTAKTPFPLDVAEPCSGLHSLLALLALTAPYAYLTQPTLLKKLLLFASAVPLAIIGNIARIVITGVGGALFGPSFAQGVSHYGAGMIVFMVAVSLMVAFGSMLKVDYQLMFEGWKKKLKSNT